MTGNQKTKTTAEQLEQHNLSVLVSSAVAKRRAGKPLTKREIAAVAELEQQRASSAATGVPPAAVVRLIVGMGATAVDEAGIRGALGDATWTSQSAVAAAFGVTVATVKHTWRPNGMPGDGKARRFPMADVLIWWLRRNAANVLARGADEHTERKRRAEAIKAEADAKSAERRMLREEGSLVSVDVVRSVWNSSLSVLSNDIMAIPRGIKPRLPVKVADDVTADVDRQLRLALVRISEKRVEDFTEDKNG